MVNAGIGGNQVVGPATYSPQQPFPGGPSAKDRLDRDVLSLSGVSAVIWLEGINDFSKNGNASIEAGMRDVVSRNPRQIFRCPDHRRHRHPGAGEHQRQSRFARRGRQAQGGQPVHPRERPV